MFKDLWRLLKTQRGLLDEAHARTSEMLNETRRMFEMVVHAIKEDVAQDFRDQIPRMDRDVNRKQIEVRKKVFEHLAISQGDDLLLGLILTSVVGDIERIGDYTKNIGDLAAFFAGRLEFGEQEALFHDFVRRTEELFRLTQLAFFGHDESAARQAQERYHDLALEADSTLKAAFERSAGDDRIAKSELAFLLLLRYLKRVGAHLKNICTTVINPYPEIGYFARSPGKS
ncbi:MAG: PhoU domain-containing protein [Planctomycetes bacterium]|nr:PhoU domain-containing protein [Planctomycetota bacterium]